MTASAGKHVLIIVENLPVPFDRRVWQEAGTLRRHGFEVSIICPRTELFPERSECIDGINIYRHPLPLEARGWFGYFVEYSVALFWQTLLSWRIHAKRRVHVIHACNPPDLIFLVALPFKLLFGVKFVFDHHDLVPELYDAKFGSVFPMQQIVLAAERMTFRLADISIATNESYRQVAISRGKMSPDQVFVVRSGPKIDAFSIMDGDETLKGRKRFLVGYVGVIGSQEGIDHLLRSAAHLVNDMARTDVLFIVMGKGPALDEMINLRNEMGLTDFVEFPGRVSDEYLCRVLSSTDVCVNPDVANEMNDRSTMNKIMEYMVFGKPIVQYDLTEGRVSAQQASLYAEPNCPRDFAKKIAHLLDHPELRTEMGQYGYTRVRQELAWQKSEPSLLAAYSRIV